MNNRPNRADDASERNDGSPRTHSELIPEHLWAVQWAESQLVGESKTGKAQPRKGELAELAQHGDEETLLAKSCHAFYRKLKTERYYTEQAAVDALMVLATRGQATPNACQAANEERLMELVDRQVDWYGERLLSPEAPARIDGLRAELSHRLAAFSSQRTPKSVRKYAEQVQLVAEVSMIPPHSQSPLAATLAQAVFQITAIRSSKRKQVRQRLVDQLRAKHKPVELQQAISILETDFQLPNALYHQPFLQQLLWPRESETEFALPPPVSELATSVVPYAAEFDRVKTAASDSTGDVDTSSTALFWIVFVGVMVIVSLARSCSSGNSTNKVPALPSKVDSQTLDGSLNFLQRQDELWQQLLERPRPSDPLQAQPQLPLLPKAGTEQAPEQAPEQSPNGARDD